MFSLTADWACHLRNVLNRYQPKVLRILPSEPHGTSKRH